MEAYIGEIKLFCGTFAPEGWHFCDGSLLSIADYDVLFALISVNYGGDGVTTFGLPDLRGRVPLHRSKDRKSTRLNSSHANISYAVFCLKKKNIKTTLH